MNKQNGVHLAANKSFRLFLTAFLFSQSGGYIQNVVMAMLVSSINGGRLGLYLFLSYLPIFLLSYPSGIIADKWRLKNIYLITEAALFILSVTLVLVSLKPPSFLFLCIFTLVWGIVRALQGPAFAAFPKRLCGEDQLPTGVMAASLALSIARAAGPALAGGLYGLWGLTAALAANSISYIPSITLISLVKENSPQKIPTLCKKSNPKSDIINSLRLFCAAFFLSFFAISYPLVFMNITKAATLKNWFFPLLISFLGVGAVGGAVFIYRSAYASRLCAVPCLVIAAVCLCFVKIHNAAVLCALAAVYGFCDYLFFTNIMTKLQAGANPKTAGRIMSLYLLVTTGALPIGTLVLSLIINNAGLKAALAVIAVGAALSAVICFWDRIKKVDKR